MLFAGSDDGVYRISGVAEGTTSAEKVLDAGRVMRLRQFDTVDGLFAASERGLYHSTDGETWTDLGVPRQHVYAVAADPAGERLYAGTRPAHLYVADVDSLLAESYLADEPARRASGVRADHWQELDAFQRLPSREEWRLPRHEDLAQVRSLCTHPSAPDRVVAGVEVGGVHVSDDGGETWTERRGAVHDDVHHLHYPAPDEFVAATGFGLYRSVDVGDSWTRLDDGDRRYFREAFTHDGVLYAGAAYASTANWEDDSGYALFECHDGERLEAADYPVPDEVPIGWCASDDGVLNVTHRGTLLAKRSSEWRRTGRVPTPGEVGGRYIPLTWVE